MGPVGAPILKFLTYCQALVFRLLMMIMWLAPAGALGAIAAVVGSTGSRAISSMFILMVAKDSLGRRVFHVLSERNNDRGTSPIWCGVPRFIFDIH